jgi:hypothetical protein
MGDGKRFTEGLADEVETLLTLSGSDKRQQARDFSAVMGSVAFGLSKITAVELVDAILGIGEGFINFFTGNESPLKAVVELAENADDLERGANAILLLAGSLERIADLKFDGSKINMKEFAEDLVESVPAIEAAIMGGKIDGGFFSSDIVYKGLASEDIKFAEATENILALRAALGETVEIPTDVSLSNRTNELGGNIDGMANGSQPVFVSNDSSSQIVNNSSSRSNINIGKNTNPPDTTINAINPRMALYGQ